MVRGLLVEVMSVRVFGWLTVPAFSPPKKTDRWRPPLLIFILRNYSYLINYYRIEIMNMSLEKCINEKLGW